MPEGMPSNRSAEVTLDILRGRIAIEVSAMAGLAAIAEICLSHRLDDLLASTSETARERMRSWLTLAKQLDRHLADSTMNAEAAAEWRAQRRPARETRTASSDDRQRQAPAREASAENPRA